MNTENFLQNFGHIVNAPEGICGLRRLIHHFAITGYLSKQHEGDSKPTSIFASAQEGKVSFFRGVRIVKRKHATLLQAPRELPKHWERIAAGDLIGLINGRAFSATDWSSSGLPIIRIQNLNDPQAPFNYFKGDVSDRHKVFPGDMLLSWSGTPGTSFGAFIWNRREAVLNQHIFKVVLFTNHMDKFFLRIALNASLDALISSARGGVGLKHVTKGQIEALQLPIPPLEEQKRIVAKVGELMTLCDRLEEQQTERQNVFPILSRVCHNRFIEDPSQSNLSRIFDLGETICLADLKRSIINLAVRGLIIPQNKNDEPPQGFLKIVEMERRRVGARRYRPVSASEMPYKLPGSWIWVRLGDLALSSDSGWSPQCERWPRSGENWGVLKVSAVSWGKFRAEENKALPANLRGRPECQVKHGDFLLSRANTIDLLARSVIVRNPPPKLMMSDKIVRFTFPELVNKEYLHLVNSCDFARNYYAQHATGTSSSMKNVSRAVMYNLPIPFPSLEEQHRIVTKVEELFILIDSLEQYQFVKKRIVEALSKAVITSFTGTDFQSEGNMKAPKTELISKLKLSREPIGADAPLLATVLSKQGNKEIAAKVLWQQSGLSIDDFYQQLRTELAQGWIEKPSAKDVYVKVQEAA